MSMTNCPNCHKPVSKLAPKCLHCNAAVKPASTDMRTCRSCKNLVDANKYSEMNASTYMHEGNTRYTYFRTWSACPHCGDPEWGAMRHGKSIRAIIAIGILLTCIIFAYQSCSQAFDGFRSLMH